MARNRLFGAAALGAALLGGGVAGAVIATPALTSAQEEAPTTEAPDDSTTTEAPDARGSDRAKDEDRGCRIGRHWFRPGLDVAAEALGISEEELRDALRDGSSIADVAEERGVELQTVIDALVASLSAEIDEMVAEGDLDEDEAAGLKADLPERVADFLEREGPGREVLKHWFRPGLDAAADALGISEEELRDALRDGSSIADLAEERGVDLQTVIDALVAEATARIDEQVAEGDLDADRAEELKERLAERIADLVEREGAARRGDHGPGRWGRGRGPR